MNAVDFKYIHIISSRLRNFKQRGTSTFNFSCPLCSDSSKNRRKARGYFLEKEGHPFFFCHNECGGMSFSNFLTRFDSSLASQYKAERFFGKTENEKIILQPIKKKENLYNDETFSTLSVLCSTLSDLSSIKQYLLSRRIPEYFLEHTFYTDKFKKFTEHLGQVIDGSEESRFIFPFYDEDKNIFGYSARAVDKKIEPRYINIILDESKPKIFGLDRWRKGEKTYVVEGAIDSMFLNSSIATGGGDIVSVLGHNSLSPFHESFVIVYDNEPHSRSTKRKIEKAIKKGFKVCIWPPESKGKDINEMIIKGQNSLDIQRIIDQNTFSGMMATLQLATWSKVR